MLRNKSAPDFTLNDQNHQAVSLSNYRGRWVVLYFYAKDESLGCTQQACSFRDEYRIIQQFGNAQVIGINQASVESHAKFSTAHRLQFPILSDPGYKVTSEYGSFKQIRAKLLGDGYATQRNTFLISPDGVIVKQYMGVTRSAKHTEQVITDLHEFQAQTTDQTIVP